MNARPHRELSPPDVARPTFLIIGLGNPGREYEGTRHNTGFDVIEAGSEKLEVKSKKWKTPRNIPAEVMEGALDGQRVTLAKPATYMNESGRAVAAIVKKYAPRSSEGSALLVVHDDLDLPIGALRLSSGGSSGGQKGVQSIIAALGTEEFLRLRIGIGPNAKPDGRRIPAEDFVLKRFRANERPAIDAAIARAVTAITTLLRDGLPAAQRFANG